MARLALGARAEAVEHPGEALLARLPGELRTKGRCDLGPLRALTDLSASTSELSTLAWGLTLPRAPGDRAAARDALRPTVAGAIALRRALVGLAFDDEERFLFRASRHDARVAPPYPSTDDAIGSAHGPEGFTPRPGGARLRAFWYRAAGRPGLRERIVALHKLLVLYAPGELVQDDETVRWSHLVGLSRRRAPIDVVLLGGPSPEWSLGNGAHGGVAGFVVVDQTLVAATIQHTADGMMTGRVSAFIEGGGAPIEEGLAFAGLLQPGPLKRTEVRRTGDGWTAVWPVEGQPAPLTLRRVSRTTILQAQDCAYDPGEPNAAGPRPLPVSSVVVEVWLKDRSLGRLLPIADEGHLPPIRWVGDLNRDGLPDFVVTAPSDSQSRSTVHLELSSPWGFQTSVYDVETVCS